MKRILLATVAALATLAMVAAGCSGTDPDTSSASDTPDSEAVDTPDAAATASTTSQTDPAIDTVPETAATTPTTEALDDRLGADGPAAELLLTADQLGPGWIQIDADSESTPPYGSDCADLRPRVADLTDTSSRRAFEHENDGRVEHSVGYADPGVVASHFAAWTAEGAHDCVQLAVEDLYDQGNLEGSIIEPEPVPEGVDGFGYRVTIVLADDTSQVVVWSSVMFVSDDRLAVVTATSPNSPLAGFGDIVERAAEKVSQRQGL